MRSRRGTGFYKVPSLRGVWYRNAFGHGGQAETLEEWLDPARLNEGYVPKGFHIGPGPIRGNEFGLTLSPADKCALIAFLKRYSVGRFGLTAFAARVGSLDSKVHHLAVLPAGLSLRHGHQFKAWYGTPLRGLLP